VLNVRDVTDRKALEAEIIHQAFHDPLTGWRTGRCSATGSTTPWTARADR
jgi:GGDEF domain-containing protein